MTIEKLTFIKIVAAFLFLIGEKYAAYTLVGVYLNNVQSEGMKIYNSR